MLLDPFLCHKLSHLLGPPPLSSVTHFTDGPSPALKLTLHGCTHTLASSGRLCVYPELNSKKRSTAILPTRQYKILKS